VLWFGRILGTVLAVLAARCIPCFVAHVAVAVLQRQNKIDTSDDTQIAWVISLCVVCAWVIMWYLSTVIGTAVDAVYVCYCEGAACEPSGSDATDLERNKHTQSYFMDPSIHKRVQEAGLQHIKSHE
jgi:hypothetical protein